MQRFQLTSYVLFQRNDFLSPSVFSPLRDTHLSVRRMRIYRCRFSLAGTKMHLSGYLVLDLHCLHRSRSACCGDCHYEGSSVSSKDPSGTSEGLPVILPECYIILGIFDGLLGMQLDEVFDAFHC